MSKMLYLAGWFLKAKLLGWRRPLQSVIYITDHCNLKCKHCTLPSVACPHTKSYRQVREELEYCYMLGARFVHFGGGEPTEWKDGEENINDLCLLARRIGFYSVSITTNAQKPLINCVANSIWVSMDGTKEFHNKIRGEGTFERLEENVAKSGHPRLFAKMTINKLNYEDVHDTLLYIRESPYFRSVSVNFHIPYKKTSDLALNRTERDKIIDLILKMKKEGYPISNSISGLKTMKKQAFDRQCWMTNYVAADGTWYPSCPGSAEGVCERCHIRLSAEMHNIFHMKIDSIISFLKFTF